MTIRKFFVGLTAIAVLGLMQLGAAAEGPTHDFETLKAMAGDWVALGQDGAPTADVLSHWDVTAGGSAVVETLFPGADHEMVTVYHMDGPNLVMTHYCAAGNQPRMKATRVSPKRLEFNCQGGSNIPSEDVSHMHGGSIEWIDANHVKTEWVNVTGGKVDHKAQFDLVRKP